MHTAAAYLYRPITGHCCSRVTAVTVPPVRCLLQKISNLPMPLRTMGTRWLALPYRIICREAELRASVIEVSYAVVDMFHLIRSTLTEIAGDGSIILNSCNTSFAIPRTAIEHAAPYINGCAWRHLLQLLVPVIPLRAHAYTFVGLLDMYQDWVKLTLWLCRPLPLSPTLSNPFLTQFHLHLQRLERHGYGPNFKWQPRVSVQEQAHQ